MPKLDKVLNGKVSDRAQPLVYKRFFISSLCWESGFGRVIATKFWFTRARSIKQKGFTSFHFPLRLTIPNPKYLFKNAKKEPLTMIQNIEQIRLKGS
jgi:hypothetical protein